MGHVVEPVRSNKYAYQLLVNDQLTKQQNETVINLSNFLNFCLHFNNILTPFSDCCHFFNVIYLKSWLGIAFEKSE